MSLFTVYLASNSPAKVAAVKNVFLRDETTMNVNADAKAENHHNIKYDLKYDLKCIPVRSGVPEQPVGELITTHGARNRLQGLVEILNTKVRPNDILIAIENGLCQRKDGVWVDLPAIVMKRNNTQITVLGTGIPTNYQPHDSKDYFGCLKRCGDRVTEHFTDNHVSREETIVMTLRIAFGNIQYKDKI